MPQRRPPEPTHRSSVSGAHLSGELSGRLVHSTSLLFELGKYAILALEALTLTHSLVLTIKIVDGPSMLPTFSTGDQVIVDRRDWVNPDQGDAVILRYPGDPDHRQYIKRVVAGPGDTVEIRSGSVRVNGIPIDEPYLAPGTTTVPDVPARVLKADEYFTLGDNRGVSNDSRFFGPVERRYLFGRVLTTLYHAQPTP
ncbi:signal peptidase I [Candidatus Berkelbacteria bacterium]|nr:signal peptidase I [Candidatus Berkelbacteria bacterium]